MTWQKVLPFLENCFVERCKGNRSNFGTDKKTGHKFSKGDVRFVCTTKGQKVYLSLDSAAEELGPVLKHVGVKEFSPVKFKGLEDLLAADRANFYKAFGVPKAAAASFDKEHPAPVDTVSDSEPPKKKQKTSKAKDAKTTKEQVESDAEHAETAIGGGDETGSEHAGVSS